MPLWFRRAQPIRLVVTVVTEGKTTKVRNQVGFQVRIQEKQYSDLENQPYKSYAYAPNTKEKEPSRPVMTKGVRPRTLVIIIVYNNIVF